MPKYSAQLPIKDIIGLSKNLLNLQESLLYYKECLESDVNSAISNWNDNKAKEFHSLLISKNEDLNKIITQIEEDITIINDEWSAKITEYLNSEI